MNEAVWKIRGDRPSVNDNSNDIAESAISSKTKGCEFFANGFAMSDYFARITQHESMGSALPDDLQFSTFMLKKTHGECPNFLGS
jgi:hypothetical protein